MKDYYAILGVDKNATEEEINKSFRKLSLQWHPDRWVNGTEEEKKKAEEKFKEISEAKDILCDPKKRQQYDMGGDEMPNMGGFNPFDIFNNMRRNVVQKGDDVYVTVNVTFKEAYSGTTKEVRYKKKAKCHHCNGTGSEDGKQATCPYCNGTGWLTETKQNGNVIFQNSHPCQHCHGTGKMVKNKCKYCNGSGFEDIECVEWIPIPPGVFTGANLKIDGKGSSPMENGIDGDLIITFNVSINPYFERPDNINVIHYEKIPLVDALLGCEKEIENPDGTKFKLKIHELTKDGEEFIQYGKGFVNAISNYPQKGDYKIIVEYIYPNKLTNKQKELLKNFN